ncbi:MAG: [LysW]-lysine hydrolase [Actinomycetota bacterium]
MNHAARAELLAEMLAIPSPSGSEQMLASFLRDRLLELGFRTSIDAVGNVLGEIGNESRPRLLLLGHIDTVPDQLAVRRDGDCLFGRGAVDAKGPLAAMICAAATPIRGCIVVVGAVEEETPASTGARHLLRTQPTPDAVVIGEPSGWSGVCIGYRGRIGIELEITRPASHSSSPEEKAIEVAVDLWREIRDHTSDLHDGDGVFQRATATLVRLEGDCERAGVDITCRVPTGFDFDRFDDFLDRIRGDARVTVDERTAAVCSERSDPVVRALTTAIRSQGARPTLKVKTGTSDMNIVKAAWSVPIAAYGPGDSKLDHTDREHVDLREFERGVEVLSAALPLLAGVGTEPTRHSRPEQTFPPTASTT